MSDNRLPSSLSFLLALWLNSFARYPVQKCRHHWQVYLFRRVGFSISFEYTFELHHNIRKGKMIADIQQSYLFPQILQVLSIVNHVHVNSSIYFLEFIIKLESSILLVDMFRLRPIWNIFTGQNNSINFNLQFVLKRSTFKSGLITCLNIISK